uniref:Leucine-rich repeat LGI family, member 2a n=1 Tax=Sinocyclocheilus rhinocerous TaxID=307959 RepID=A0A673HHH4_9TELE
YFNMRTVAIISALVLCLASLGNAGKKVFKCPSSCSCSKESIICVGSSYIPRFIPNDVSSLSLANNNIKALPRDLFIDLDSLIELDLRGNVFECDCRAKWLMMWLKSTNATVSDVLCAGPEEMKGKRLNDMASLHNECISTDFIPLHSVSTESLSVDTFSHKNDVYVAIAAPNIESCMVLQWDHIEMNFRSYDNITGTVMVKPSYEGLRMAK